MIEFVLSVGLVLIPLLLGTIAIGLNLVRINQVTEVCRDAAHMYGYGVVDFSQPASQNLLVQLSQGLNMTATSGSGVVILSTITYVDSTSCAAAGYAPSSCANINQTVFTNRIVIGNSSLYPSFFGTPAASIVTANGNISVSDYLTNPSARALNFSNLITLASGQYAFMSEMIVIPSTSLGSVFGGGVISSRSIF